MADAEKVRANRLRRSAARQGLKLVKSRRRDPRAYDFGTYMLVNIHTDTPVHGNVPDLVYIEAWLAKDFDDQYPTTEIKTPDGDLPVPDIESAVFDLTVTLVSAIAPEWPQAQVWGASVDISAEIVQPAIEGAIYDSLCDIKDHLNRIVQDHSDKVAWRLLEQV